MTKTEMVAGVLHASGFNSNADACYAFAHAMLLEEAGSALAFREWDSEVPDNFAKRYIEDRSTVTSVRWDNLYRELT